MGLSSEGPLRTTMDNASSCLNGGALQELCGECEYCLSQSLYSVRGLLERFEWKDDRERSKVSKGSSYKCKIRCLECRHDVLMEAQYMSCGGDCGHCNGRLTNMCSMSCKICYELSAAMLCRSEWLDVTSSHTEEGLFKLKNDSQSKVKIRCKEKGHVQEMSIKDLLEVGYCKECLR